ncbi:LOW QUALITY PROTEIN: hypothetical protein CRUP_006826 [Coryphaenoides rupestris]|nr:LOW QUALITY PROTEIN: hypothetical protein CRUP_006826 [Coryphaenoides rupestris]
MVVVVEVMIEVVLEVEVEVMVEVVVVEVIVEVVVVVHHLCLALLARACRFAAPPHTVPNTSFSTRRASVRGSSLPDTTTLLVALITSAGPWLLSQAWACCRALGPSSSSSSKPSASPICSAVSGSTFRAPASSRRAWRPPTMGTSLAAPPQPGTRPMLVTRDSRIQFVHKHMGLVPGWGGAARLVPIVGGRHALRLLAGALKVDPETALQMGLADGLLEEEERAPAQAWLSSYTQGPAEVIRATKRVVVSGRELPLTEALRVEKEVFGTVWGGAANLQALASKAKHK